MLLIVTDMKFVPAAIDGPQLGVARVLSHRHPLSSSVLVLLSVIILQRESGVLFQTPGVYTSA